MKRLFSLLTLLGLVLFCASPSYAQKRELSGKVVEAGSATPLDYAFVGVKGLPNINTYTVATGEFTLKNVPAEATHLIVSYMGYVDAEVEIKGTSNIIVELMPDAVALDQVVVTALGIQRQAKELGYATAKVNSEDLVKGQNSDASQALIGKISGLQISLESGALDAGVKINLRGSRSFTGDNQALLVVDGVPTPLDYLQSLNPNDIENISVLKGGSAAALYGSSAANGVLYVTTKKGERGKPRLTYSLTTTLDHVSYFPKYQTRFGSGGDNATTGFGYYIPYENQQYGPEFDGSTVDIGLPIQLEDGSIKQLTETYDYKEGAREDFYQMGVSIQNDVSYASSSENGSFFLSYQNVDKTGTIINDKMNRQTVRMSATKSYGKLKASVTSSYSNTKLDMTRSNGMYELWNTPAHINLPQYEDWQNVEGANPDQYINAYYLNPYSELDLYRKDNRYDRFSGSANMEYKPLSWLSFQGRVGMNLSVGNTNSITNPWHFSEYAKNQSARSAANGGDIYSSLSTSSSYYNNINTDVMAFAKHEFSENFKINGMLGWSLQDSYSESKNVSAGKLEVDGLFNMDNRVGELGGSNKYSQIRKQSVYASVDLSFYDWIFLQVTGRNDWTSVLAPENRSFFYPGANMSMMLSDVIPALKNSSALSYLKLRGSASMIGTVNIGTYQLDDLAFAYGEFPFGDMASYYMSKSLRNRDISPEFTTEYEIGVELGMFKDRVVFEGAVYQQKTVGQTVNITMPISTGASSRYMNAGTMRGRGIELDLKLTPLFKLGDFRWNLNANATFTKTEVTELYGDASEINIYSAVYAILGEQYPMIKATDYERDPQGRVVVDPVNGYPILGNLENMGTTEPTCRIGLSSNLKWKNLSLSATFDYRGGAVTRFNSEYDMLFSGSSYTSAITGRQRFVFPNSVIKVENPDGSVSYEENTNVTVSSAGRDFWDVRYKSCRAATVVSANVWKLREASLNYEIPQKLIDKTNGVLQRASIGLVGRNLFMWTPDTNLWGDPENFSGNGGYSNATGMAGSLVGSRTYGFNLLISF